LKLNVDRNTINESINLVDYALRQIYHLNGEIVLNSISKCKIYRLIIGKDAYIEKLKDEYRPAEFQLYQNYPNPFNPTSQIRFALPKPSSITLNVYNILGQSVECLIRNEQYQPGNYEIQFSGKGLASGVYILQLRADEEVKNIKMQLLK